MRACLCLIAVRIQTAICRCAVAASYLCGTTRNWQTLPPLIPCKELYPCILSNQRTQHPPSQALQTETLYRNPPLF